MFSRPFSTGTVSPYVSGPSENPPYAPYTEVEGGVTLKFYSISAMSAYRQRSFEEIRLEDYGKGRKGKQVGPSTSFSTGTTLGSTSSFMGQQQQPASPFTSSLNIQQSPFGKVMPTSPAPTFGQPKTTGFGTISGFGTQPTFGQQTAMSTQPQSTFGQAGVTSTLGGISQSHFGQPAQPAVGFGGPSSLGQPQTTTTGYGTSTFGQPSSGFGTQPSTQSFGQPQSSGFGQQAQSSGFGQQAPTSAFGQPSANLFGQPSSPFGQPQQQQQSSSLFNAPPTTAQSGGGFGISSAFNQPPTTQTQQTSSTTGSIFGQTSQPLGQFSIQPTSGLFSSTAQPTTGGLFSQPFQQQGSTQQSGFPTLAPSAPTLPGLNAASPSSFWNKPSTTTTLPQPSFQHTASTLPVIQAPTNLISPPTLPALLAKPTVPSVEHAKPSPPLTTPMPRTPLRLVERVLPFVQVQSLQSQPYAASYTQLVPRRTFSAATGSVRRLIVEPYGAGDAQISSQLAPTPRVPSTKEGKKRSGEEKSDSDQMTFGDFYTIPNESTLKRYSPSQLQSVSNFVVGQRNVGQVRFLRPVNLTNVDLDELFSKYILFQHSRIDIYPDIYFTSSPDEVIATHKTIRPQPGQGLNVPAQIRLDRCWPVNRSTRETITDTNNPRFMEHLERLKSQSDLKFIDFVVETGSWIFEIDSF